jgi:hypothetical protein
LLACPEKLSDSEAPNGPAKRLKLDSLRARQLNFSVSQLDVPLIIFQQLAAEFLLIENRLVNLSESLANPTVKVLRLSL